MVSTKKFISSKFKRRDVSKDNLIIPKKYVVVFFFLLCILALIVIILKFFMGEIFGTYFTETPVCGDGSFYDTCSLKKPYFCDDGTLVEKASVCGCVDILMKSDDSCISKYQNGPKAITLKYVLRGEEKEIKYIAYKGMSDYLSNLSRSIYYQDSEKPFRADFKLKSINEEEQREFLLPLVVKIQNLVEDKEDQVRIAISIVQNIHFGNSEKNTTDKRINGVAYFRYPYEVLYDVEGNCGEKSGLLAFLLREIDYGVVFFYHNLENHESIGIKCPLEYSLGGTGYCFVETTGPSIITDNKVEYIGQVELSSEPELVLISDGNSLGEDLYEYEDAKDLIKIRNSLEEKGKINFIKQFKFKKLEEKYGLVQSYRL